MVSLTVMFRACTVSLRLATKKIFLEPIYSLCNIPPVPVMLLIETIPDRAALEDAQAAAERASTWICDARLREKQFVRNDYPSGFLRKQSQPTCTGGLQVRVTDT